MLLGHWLSALASAGLQSPSAKRHAQGMAQSKTDRCYRCTSLCLKERLTTVVSPVHREYHLCEDCARRPDSADWLRWAWDRPVRDDVIRLAS